MGIAGIDEQALCELRDILLVAFQEDDEGFRELVKDLGGAKLSQALPGSGATMRVLVSGAVEALANHWPKIYPVLFDKLAARRPQHREQIEYWRARLCPGPVGDYGVVLVHVGEAVGWHLCAVLERALFLRPGEGARIVASAPRPIAQGRDERGALALGREIEATGAVVSYSSPAAGRCLPRLVRSPAGATLARIPPRGGACPFWLMSVPVTRALFNAVMGRSPGPRDKGQLPVHGITRDEATVFCQRLSDHEGLAGPRYRLPNEEEWERAARAEDQTRYPGSDAWAAIAWGVSSTEPMPVRKLAANGWGLHDMAGNVWEWVADTHRGDPRLGILKGGCYASAAGELVPEARRLAPPDRRDPTHGLRVARSISAGDEGNEA